MHEQVNEATEREATEIIKALVEQELQHSADIVMEEGKEESIEKEQVSIGGGPSLM
ncbi:hypothetical protein KI387_007694, partial [Taxus chinensis]